VKQLTQFETVLDVLADVLRFPEPASWDDREEPLGTYTVVADSVPFRIETYDTDEYAGRQSSTDDLVGYCKPTVDVRAADVIRTGDKYYEVVGSPMLFRDIGVDHHWELMLRKRGAVEVI